MTDAEKALATLNEWQISRATGNLDLEYEKGLAMIRAVRPVLLHADKAQGLVEALEDIAKQKYFSVGRQKARISLAKYKETT